MLPFLLNHSAVGSAQPALPIRRRLGEGGSQSNGPVRRSPELVERGEGGSIPAVSLPNPSNGPVLNASNGPALSKRNASNGFTIIEVMMASVILVVGFIGMIQGITVGSEMLATARRQTLAAQIINHETEKLRLATWTTVSGYPTSSTSITIDSQFNNSMAACGLTSSDITLSRTATDLTTDLREISFTLTWTKSGSSTAATTPTGSWLDQLAFYRPSSIARTYTRKMSAYFGKYGLSLNAQR